MTKIDIVYYIAERMNITQRAAEKYLDTLINVLTETLAKGGKIKFVGFGSFEVRDRAARKGYNPHTCEEIVIPACKEPTFKPGKELKEIVNLEQ